MTTAPDSDLPVFDAAGAMCISDEAAARYQRDGLLVIRNVVAQAELEVLQRETAELVERAASQVASHVDRRAGGDPDFLYKEHEVTGEVVPFRVEYVVDKLESTKVLLGHPFLLRTVEKLQGPAFVPTWDSMVFKMAGAGAAIPWHRDGGLYRDSVAMLATGRVFNVDVYLDRAGLDSCLWGLLGSNNWSEDEASAAIERMNEGGVSTAGAVPIPMQPGDVLVHNVLVLHGSRPTQGALRRVLYYEFRPADIELVHGPHTPEYVRAKQQVQAAAIRRRAQASYASGEVPYAYVPGAGDVPDGDPPTWRYPHHEHWLAATGAA